MRISQQRRFAIEGLIRRCARFLVLAAGVVSCHAGSRPGSHSVDSLLRKALSEEVERNSYWRPLARMARDSMIVHPDSSRVVPGLVYYHGYFVPPNTADVGPFSVVVGARSGTALVLSTPADWGMLAGQWEPRDGAAAVQACMEIIDHSSPRFGQGTHAVFLDSAQLVANLMIADPAPLLARVSPPRASVSDRGDWTVKLWDVRRMRTIQVDCTIASSRGRPRASIAMRDTIPLGAEPFF